MKSAAIATTSAFPASSPQRPASRSNRYTRTIRNARKSLRQNTMTISNRYKNNTPTLLTRRELQLPFHHSFRSTRDNRTSRNARISLKINDGDTFYPRRILRPVLWRGVEPNLGQSAKTKGCRAEGRGATFKPKFHVGTRCLDSLIRLTYFGGVPNRRKGLVRVRQVVGYGWRNLEGGISWQLALR